MRCEERQLLLDEYVVGELDAPAARDLTAHVAACERCGSALGQLRQEGELYAWYEDDIWDDGDLEITPALWAGVSARIATDKARRRTDVFARVREWLRVDPHFKPAAVIATLLLVALAFAWALFNGPRRTRDGVEEVAAGNIRAEGEHAGAAPARGGGAPVAEQTTTRGVGEDVGATDGARADARRRARRATNALTANSSPRGGHAALNVGEVEAAGLGEASATNAAEAEAARQDVSGVGGYDSETVRHFGQAQNLLRSFRHAGLSPTDGLAYEKSLSKRLLDRNVLLRLGAASKGDLLAERALGSIEPVLLDISHLPDRPSPEDLRPIRERIERGELIAALQVYQPQPR